MLPLAPLQISFSPVFGCWINGLQSCEQCMLLVNELILIPCIRWRLVTPLQEVSEKARHPSHLAKCLDCHVVMSCWSLSSPFKIGCLLSGREVAYCSAAGILWEPGSRWGTPA